MVGQRQVLQPQQQRLMAPQQPQQQMYGTVTQRFWAQNPSQGKPQRGPMMRSPPQQRLQTPRYMTSGSQQPQDPTDMLLFQQQNDFGGQQNTGQNQQQELTPQDQLTKFVENL